MNQIDEPWFLPQAISLYQNTIQGFASTIFLIKERG